MTSFTFGQIQFASKDFYKQRQITDMLKIDVNKIVVSDRVSCNNGRNWHYIVGYQVDTETIIPLFIKTPETYLAIACHNLTRTAIAQFYLIFLKSCSGCLNIETSGIRLSRS